MSRPSLEGVECLQETDMEAARFVAMFVAIFAALFVAIIFSLIQSGERWRAAQERARARRIADARMNARLLRLNL
jgi:cbb3-type cytochrome oxidase subunit 3